MRCKLFKLDNFEYTYMNWIGKYTYGSIFFRGTRICLRNSIGMIYGENDYKSIVDEAQLDNMKLTNNIMFWDDSTFRADSIDDFLDLDKYFEFPNYRILDRTSVDEIFNGDDSLFDWSYSDKFVDNYEKYKIRTQNADMIIAEPYNENLFIIDNIDMLIDELQDVNIYAKMNNVRFDWI